MDKYARLDAFATGLLGIQKTAEAMHTMNTGDKHRGKGKAHDISALATMPLPGVSLIPHLIGGPVDIVKARRLKKDLAARGMLD
jgi:hypothetical protein